MAEPTSCCVEPGGYCARVDTLFNLLGVHVLDVAWLEGRGRLPAGLRLIVETGATEAGCPACGVIAEARGRRSRRLHDIPAFGAPVELELAAASLPLRRAGLPGRWVQRGPRAGCAAGQAHRPGGLVGDQLHPTRHRLGRLGGPPARGGLAHGLGRRSSRCWRSWPTTPTGWPGSTPSGSTSTSGTTSPGPGRDRRSRPGSWT